MTTLLGLPILSESSSIIFEPAILSLSKAVSFQCSVSSLLRTPHVRKLDDQLPPISKPHLQFETDKSSTYNVSSPLTARYSPSVMRLSPLQRLLSHAVKFNMVAAVYVQRNNILLINGSLIKLIALNVSTFFYLTC